jgi:hypothetical protein
MENDPSSQLLAEQLKHLNTLYKARMDALEEKLKHTKEISPFGPTINLMIFLIFWSSSDGKRSLFPASRRTAKTPQHPLQGPYECPCRVGSVFYPP